MEFQSYIFIFTVAIKHNFDNFKACGLAEARKKIQKNTRSDMKIQKYSSDQVINYSIIQVFKYLITQHTAPTATAG